MVYKVIIGLAITLNIIIVIPVRAYIAITRQHGNLEVPGRVEIDPASLPDLQDLQFERDCTDTVLGTQKSPPVGFLAITRYHGVGEVPG